MKDISRIPLYSPLFRQKINGNTIYIKLRNDNYKILKEEYNNLLNKSDIKYSSIYFYFDNNVTFLKELNIDFNKIVKITLDKGNEFKTDNNYVFQTLFSLNNIENNLISLTILFRWNEEEFTNFLKRKPSEKVKSDSFEKINNLKTLKYLCIKYVNFVENVKIKLSNLKELIVVSCENLDLSDIICPKLEKLYFFRKDEPNLNYFKGINKNSKI